MKTNRDALIELLYEFDDLCRENGIKYSIVGKTAAKMIETGEFPKSLNRLRLVMAYGDICRIMEVLKTDPKYSRRKLEYAGNNPKAVDFRYRYINMDAVLVNLTECRITDNYGVYLSISEIERNRNKEDVKEFRRQLLKVRQPGKGKGGLIANYRAKRIVEQRGKLIGIDTWDDMFKYKRIRIGEKRLLTDNFREIKTVTIDGHNFTIAEKLIGKLKSMRLISGMGYLTYDIRVPNMPVEEFAKEIPKKEWKRIQEEERLYEQGVIQAAKEFEKIEQAYATFEMAKEIVDIQKTLEGLDLENFSSEEERESLEQLVRRYRKYRKVNSKKKIDYIKEEKLEKLADEYVLSSKKKEEDEEQESEGLFFSEDEEK